MTKEEQIAEIKRIIIEWGPTTSGELELGCSPCINSIGEDIVQLAERFNANEVDYSVYHNGIEIETDYIPYEDLSEDVIHEIYEIMEEYDADMDKTYKRIEN